MPWPDSISLIRESWISQLEFLVNTEAREYQDDGLDGEKGWLSFFFFLFFSYEEENWLLDSNHFLFNVWKDLSIFYHFVVSKLFWNFEKKECSIIKIWVNSSIFPLFSFTNYTLEKIHKTQQNFVLLLIILVTIRNDLKKLNFLQLYHFSPNSPI